nr:hypothetical protein [Clostridioides difficile]
MTLFYFLWSYNFCFILTMWYVNFSASSTMLYSSNGFILTMWYVNAHLTSSLRVLSASFILTMWYVNFVQLLS